MAYIEEEKTLFTTAGIHVYAGPDPDDMVHSKQDIKMNCSAIKQILFLTLGFSTEGYSTRIHQ